MARQFLAKGCVYHIVRVYNFNVEKHIIQLVLVVIQFPKVFPDNFPKVPHERDIVFCMDILPHTRPISISLYRMETIDLKDLKE